MRRAAVLCPILSRDGEDQLLFVLHHEGPHAHAGQIGFPGGMREGDESPLQTALRECHEEVGAPPDIVAPLGELPPRSSTSSIDVHCVVGRVAPFEIVRDEREVARVLFAPLRALADAGNWRDAPLPTAAPVATGSPTVGPSTTLQFDLDGAVLWGLTARFVRDLCARIV